MIETIHDLEAIREALQLPTWHFAGHSTGGMLGLLYAITYPKVLTIISTRWSGSKQLHRNTLLHLSSRTPAVSLYATTHRKLKNPLLTSEERKELSTERTKLSLHKPENYNSYFDKPIQK